MIILHNLGMSYKKKPKGNWSHTYLETKYSDDSYLESVRFFYDHGGDKYGFLQQETVGEE